MTRRKLERFAYNEENPLLIQAGKPLYTTIKGRWREIMFANQQPIILELGCGKGEYTIGLAQRNPENNYIGIDIKGDRIARGVAQATELGLTNVAFLRADIRFLYEFFADEEINGIWITFPDPHAGDRGKKNRLTSPRFLAIYRPFLPVGGAIHLKTDNEELFEYTLSVIEEFSQDWKLGAFTTNLYDSELNIFQEGIRTKYEEEFFSKGFSIKYASFSKVEE